MISRVNSATYEGVEGQTVLIETDIANGLPSFVIVGLAAASVMESRDRVRAAVLNSGMNFPRGRLTVDLIPADLRKRGSHFDLPIAVGILITQNEVNRRNALDYGMIGELTLDGSVAPVKGVLPMIIAMKNSGIKKIIVPEENFREAKLVECVDIFPVDTLRKAVELINGSLNENLIDNCIYLIKKNGKCADCDNEMVSFDEIKGQEQAKRAALIAAAGNHAMLMVGGPGCGKTMLARRLPNILPEMSSDEIVETATVYSVLGNGEIESIMKKKRPFRMPHHTVGRAALLGGGNYPVPGEITLSHNGVLFLDEVGEFKTEVLEGLRQPMEDKFVLHARHGRIYRFPSRFLLVMASNPCPCGYFGDEEHRCTCSQREINSYNKRFSGPLLDRIDIQIFMKKVSYDDICAHDMHEYTEKKMKALVYESIEFARERGRVKKSGDYSNAEVSKYCVLNGSAEKFMKLAYKKYDLSPRAYTKVLKVARTIADLEFSEYINEEHLAEAFAYRVIAGEEHE